MSQYDLIIIGTPVWAWKPAPAMNAAVQALTGCEGKMAVIFVTCSGQPGEALSLLNTALTERGVEVMAEICLTPRIRKTRAVGNELLGRIAAALPVLPGT